jgi:N6-L-threonylcarbamoyladenine synthase
VVTFCSTSRNRIVLGIESSCDDTAAAVVSGAGEILGEAIATQEEVHREWGGVVPSLAQAAHQHAIDSVVDKAMKAADIKYSDLDAVAFTIGPGLGLCLQVGALKAKRVAGQHQLPLVPCHHMEAHALVARLNSRVDFPFLCLLVSGGHNLLLIVRGVGDYMQVRPVPGLQLYARVHT